MLCGPFCFRKIHTLAAAGRTNRRPRRKQSGLWGSNPEESEGEVVLGTDESRSGAKSENSGDCQCVAPREIPGGAVGDTHMSGGGISEVLK